MKLNEIKSIGTAAIVATFLGTACNTSPSKELCEDYLGDGARSVSGACLSPEFTNVDALRAKCKGDVAQTEVTLCECKGIKGKIWTCIEDD